MSTYLGVRRNRLSSDKKNRKNIFDYEVEDWVCLLSVFLSVSISALVSVCMDFPPADPSTYEHNYPLLSNQNHGLLQSSCKRIAPQITRIDDPSLPHSRTERVSEVSDLFRGGTKAVVTREL